MCRRPCGPGWTLDWATVWLDRALQADHVPSRTLSGLKTFEFDKISQDDHHLCRPLQPSTALSFLLLQILEFASKVISCPVIQMPLLKQKAQFQKMMSQPENRVKTRRKIEQLKQIITTTANQQAVLPLSLIPL